MSVLTPEIREYIHEIADVVINANGYADWAAASDVRWQQRNDLETLLGEAVDNVLRNWQA